MAYIIVSNPAQKVFFDKKDPQVPQKALKPLVYKSLYAAGLHYKALRKTRKPRIIMRLDAFRTKLTTLYRNISKAVHLGHIGCSLSVTVCYVI